MPNSNIKSIMDQNPTRSNCPSTLVQGIKNIVSISKTINNIATK